MCVGEAGKNGNGHSEITAGSYNGGGGGATGAIGGGATHIAITNRGELYNYQKYQSEVLIVAGGSGGSEVRSVGGSGGGGNNSGGNGGYQSGMRAYGTGGTQTAGGTAIITGDLEPSATQDMILPGSFGKGGGCNGKDLAGGGGGGWYGGGGVAVNYGNGGGGSGHIGDGFISGTTGGYSVSRTGNGYAVISWHPAI